MAQLTNRFVWKQQQQRQHNRSIITSGTRAMDLEEGSSSHGNPLLEGGGAIQEVPPGGEQQAGPMTDSTTNAMQQASNLPEMSVQEGKEATARQRWWTRVVIIVASLAMAVAIAAMALEASAVAIVAFCIPLITSPYAIYQRKQLNKLPTLVHVINETRHQVNRLTQQNERFSHENDRLSMEVAELQKLDQEFYNVCQRFGTSVDDMKNLIKENGSLQKQQKQILDAQQLQDIFSAILRSDTNQDFKLTDQEIDRFMLRLKGYNVVNKERLKETLLQWSSKSDLAEWRRMEEDADGGTITGFKGWTF